MTVSSCQVQILGHLWLECFSCFQTVSCQRQDGASPWEGLLMGACGGGSVRRKIWVRVKREHKCIWLKMGNLKSTKQYKGIQVNTSATTICAWNSLFLNTILIRLSMQLHTHAFAAKFVHVQEVADTHRSPLYLKVHLSRIAVKLPIAK